MIELEHITKSYDGSVVAVDDISLEIEEGEFVTVVGPSGCGKSTTLRLIAGFERHNTGTVTIGGRDVTNDPPYTRKTGLVFQNFALFPHMTVAENVAYGLNARGGRSKTEIEERVDEMLELVRLPGFGDRMPAQLSGGQQQRIALARALAPDNDVLLLDEPLASLDKNLKEQMQIELQKIQAEINITTVFVTHDQTEALTLSDRIAVMNDGQLEQVDTPDRVYNHPETRFVAEFIGKSNIFDGVVDSVANDRVSVDCGEYVLEFSPTHTNGITAGKSMEFVVRPEKLSVRGNGGADNTFEGVIRSRRNMGSTVEYHVDVGDRQLVVSEQSGDDDLATGETVTVQLAVDKSIATL